LNGISTIKDAIYLSDKSPEELFISYGAKRVMHKDSFMKLVKSLNENLNETLVESIFYYLTKIDRPLNIEEFSLTFVAKPPDDNFEISALRKINEKYRQLHFSLDEYFDHLLCIKVNVNEKKLTKSEFFKVMKKDNYNFSAQEVHFLFKCLDKKGDNFLDREEFTEKMKILSDPIFIIQDFIKKNKLNIEDILNKMQIERNKNIEFDYNNFRISILIT
jgi:Ca2+-binding EF-hand superfamily protein